MDPEALERDLRAFLRDELGVPDASTARDTELVTTGLVDSADLVRLATYIERKSGIAIPDRDITAAHFDSIAKILEYVRTRS